MSFRSYVLSLMKDERKGPTALVVKGVLRVLSWFYAAGIRIVDWSYASGMRKTHKMDVPVISVGNITLGGTGKTPMSIYLAEHFLSCARKPAVLTRGYGRDECRMIKDELADVPVIVGQDRVRSARRALREGSDVLILDDGFQHRRVARDVNVLLLDGTSPFGNGCLFPRGILREPVSSVRRADIFVITKADRADEASLAKVRDRLESIAPGRRVILSRHKPTFLTDVTGSAYPVESLKGKKVCLASGIVDPDYFASLVEAAGAAVVLRFDHTDHYAYGQNDINRISAGCAEKDAEMIIVTKKDYVKIKKLDLSGIEDKLFILNVVMDIVSGKEDLVSGLDSVLRG